MKNDLDPKTSAASGILDEDLLRILACPACRADVRLENGKIVCLGCNKKYPIKDGIPVMLVEEAEG